MYECIVCMYVSVRHVCSIQRPEGVECLDREVTDGWKPPCRQWEVNLGLLQEQSTPVAAETSLRPLLLVILLRESICHRSDFTFSKC